MWILRFASKDIGMFQSVESAQLYLANQYGNECVTLLGEFTPMIGIKTRVSDYKTKKQVVPESGRGKCYAFECKSSQDGWESTQRYELEQIEILD